MGFEHFCTDTFSGSARILTDLCRACNFEEDVFQGETFDLLHQENVRRLRSGSRQPSIVLVKICFAVPVLENLS